MDIIEEMYPAWKTAGRKLMRELPGWDVNDLDLLQLRYIRRVRGESEYWVDRYAMRDGDLLVALNDDANPPGWYFEKFDADDDNRELLLQIARDEQKRRFDKLGART